MWASNQSLNASLQFRLADPSDAKALHDIRVAAIRRLTLTHLSAREAEDWAGRGGIPRVERAIANDEVWIAMRDLDVVGWIHRAANSIEGLYVSPTAASQGVGTALITLVESRIAETSDDFVILESSINAVGFYIRLGYEPTGIQGSSGAVQMRKLHAAA